MALCISRRFVLLRSLKRRTSSWFAAAPWSSNLYNKYHYKIKQKQQLQSLEEAGGDCWGCWLPPQPLRSHSGTPLVKQQQCFLKMQQHQEQFQHHQYHDQHKKQDLLYIEEQQLQNIYNYYQEDKQYYQQKKEDLEQQQNYSQQPLHQQQKHGRYNIDNTLGNSFHYQNSTILVYPMNLLQNPFNEIVSSAGLYYENILLEYFKRKVNDFIRIYTNHSTMGTQAYYFDHKYMHDKCTQKTLQQICFGCKEPYRNCRNRNLLFLLFVFCGAEIAKETKVLAEDAAGGGKDSYEVDTKSAFASLFYDEEELAVTNTLELSEVQSLTHSHLLRQSAGVAAEASLLLLCRACAALLDVTGRYKKSLHDLLDLHEYQATLAEKSQRGAHYEQAIEAVTEASVVAAAQVFNWKRQYNDLQLLVRMSVPAFESLCQAAYMTGGDCTALAATAAVAALKEQVERGEAEVRQLQSQLLAAKTAIIEHEQQQQEQVNDDQQDGEEDEPEEGSTVEEVIRDKEEEKIKEEKQD